MKKRTIYILVVLLAFAFAGCDSADYKKGLQAYGRGDYSAARDYFKKLGDYKDSAVWVTKSEYGIAVQAFENADYLTALDAFSTLGNYNDSPEYVRKSKYHLGTIFAVSGKYEEAAVLLEEVGDYEDALQFLRKVRWHQLYNYIVAKGDKNQNGDGFYITCPDGKAENDYSFFLIADGDNLEAIISKTTMYVGLIEFGVTMTTKSSLLLYIPEVAETAVFGGQYELSCETLNTFDSETIAGTLEIKTVKPNSKLAITGLDQKKTTEGKTTKSTDPKDSLMKDELSEMWKVLVEGLKDTLDETELGIKLADLGFENLR